MELPAPVNSFSSRVKTVSLLIRNRVDGRVLFPSVDLPHLGGTAHYNCDAQVAPPSNQPLNLQLTHWLTLPTQYPELFDINEQMAFEYPETNIRLGWWAVSVCMNYWQNRGTEDDPEQVFIRKRCAEGFTCGSKAIISGRGQRRGAITG